MKQAQSEKARYGWSSQVRLREQAAPRSRRRVDRFLATEASYVDAAGAWFWVEMFWSVLGTLWFVISAPFRLVFWTIAWVGRVTAILLGFCLMVIGIALGAGPLFFLGIPLFLVGLVLTLKCLD
jgi:hypothetical protein